MFYNTDIFFKKTTQLEFVFTLTGTWIPAWLS